MNERSQSLFRAASLIHDCIVRRRHDLTSLQLPEGQWAGCVQALGQIQRATQRGWHRAAAQLREELLREVDCCRNYLKQLSHELVELGSAHKIPSEGDIYREMLALESEFEEVKCDLDSTELCVTTPSVTLEGVYLGPFQIRLDWSRLDKSPAYRVIALDANPPLSDDSVVHPHVSSETLCEGDGQQAIRAALDEGRLADFFLLVWRLLDTYAPGRAYVELSDWHGSPCHECGASTGEDDRCFCCRCDEVFCSGCMSSCPHCDQDFCMGCISTCPSCDSSVCDGCRDACNACREVVCPGCLTDGKCTQCCEKQEDEEQDHDETDPLLESDAGATTPAQPVVEADHFANEGTCHV